MLGSLRRNELITEIQSLWREASRTQKAGDRRLRSLVYTTESGDFKEDYLRWKLYCLLGHSYDKMVPLLGHIQLIAPRHRAAEGFIVGGLPRN